MQRAENVAQKNAYIEAVGIYLINRTTLKILHGVNDNMLDKWLYVPGRFPSFKACLELMLYLRAKNLTVPRALLRITKEPQYKALNAAGLKTQETGAEIK